MNSKCLAKRPECCSKPSHLPAWFSPQFLCSITGQLLNPPAWRTSAIPRTGASTQPTCMQNADDAGATKITFCLDHRQHGTASLAYEKLAPFQGPALYVHNNSVFSEADFQSISRIGDSGKSRQAGKTGKGLPQPRAV